MPIDIHDNGNRNYVLIPASVRDCQVGTIVLDGDDNRVIIGDGAAVHGARIRLGSRCSFECGPGCRLGDIDVHADHDSHVRIGAGSDLAGSGCFPAEHRDMTASAPAMAQEARDASPTSGGAGAGAATAMPIGLTTTVHPRDHAMRHHLEYFGDTVVAESAYLCQGVWSADAAEQIAHAWFGGLSRVSRMLIFGPDFGYVTRHLIQDIPPERLWCADTDPDAVRFVRETFGLHGFVAPANPAAIRCAEHFDLIYAPLAFSQISEERFEPLLERLLEMVKPGGVLAFGTRDELWYAPNPMPPDGFVFVPAAEPDRPSVSIVTEHFVRGCIERINGLDWPYRRLPRGLCSHFDLYVVGNDEAMATAADRVRIGPEGCMDHCLRTERGIEISGWAGDPDPGHQSPTVEVMLDGKLVARTRPSLPRPDVAAILQESSYAAAGWMIVIQPPEQPPDWTGLTLEVRVVADDGRVRPLAAGVVAAFVGRRLG